MSHSVIAPSGILAPKLDGNSARDERDQHRLKDVGWRVYKEWECEATLRSFLPSQYPARGQSGSRQYLFRSDGIVVTKVLKGRVGVLPDLVR